MTGLFFSTTAALLALGLLLLSLQAVKKRLLRILRQ